MKNILVKIVAAVAVLGVAGGCASPKVRVDFPPKFDVGAYAAYGLVQFASSGPEDLRVMASQQFMQFLQGAKQGVIVVELGTEQAVLASVGKTRLDLESIRAIGEKYKINALIVGGIDVAKEKVNVSLKDNLSGITAQSRVRVTMNAKIFETARGATAWTNSRFGTWTMSGASVDGTGVRSVSVVTDKETKYVSIVGELASAVTMDFRPTYEMRKVQK